MNTLIIALKSAWSRKTSLSLALFSIALSIFLLLSVDMLRKQAKNSFINSISQTDLIVGAKSSPTHILLYSLFQIGRPTNNLSYQSFQEIRQFKEVSWAVPISLGDSHRGYKIIATTADFFRHYKYAQKQPLQLQKGRYFGDLFDVVIGSEVAKNLNYSLKSPLIVNHGLQETSHSQHTEYPFKVSGILEPTATPLDAKIFISLEAWEAIHLNWQAGTKLPIALSPLQLEKMQLTPTSISAFFIGLENRMQVFRLQQRINNFAAEPLEAVLPGVALASLWQTLGQFENLLLGISLVVLVSGLLGVFTTLLSTLNHRRQEIAVLRSLGANSRHILALFAFESFLVSFLGCVLGVIFVYLALGLLGPFVAANYAVSLSLVFLDSFQLGILALALGVCLLLSLVPGYLAYRKSLQDGLHLMS